MPSRIPVQVADHAFSSINQARKHFTPLLHKYPDGHRFSRADMQEIKGLLESSGSSYANDEIDVCASTGRFGNKQLICIGPDNVPHRISLSDSFKRCVERQMGTSKFD